MDSAKFLEMYSTHYPCPKNYYQIVRIDICDYDLVHHLNCPFGMDFFNSDDLKYKISNSFCTLGIQTTKMDIVAIVCFSTVPNIPTVPFDVWEYWIDYCYNLKKLACHTMFINYMAFESSETFSFFRPILHCIFFEYFYVKDILLYVPYNCNQFEWLEGTEQRAKYYGSAKMPLFRIMNRNDYSYQYKLRKAAEEDNDVLVPLIDIFSPLFIEMYGHYFVSEIIRTPLHKHRSIFVCEYNNEIVGVIFTNTKVNYERLKFNFELECYQGLQSEQEYKKYTSLSSLLKIQPITIEQTQKSTELIKDTKESEQHEELITENDVQNLPMTSVMASDSESNISSLFSIVSAESERSSSSTVTTAQSADSYYYASNMLLEHMELANLNTGKAHKAKEPKQSQMSIIRKLRSDFETKHWKTNINNSMEGNAFAIEILVTYPGHEDCIPKLLNLSFNVHQLYDYAVLSLPSNCSSMTFQKYFVKVSPQPDSNFQHDLYVINRYSIYDEIIVRSTQYLDKVNVEEMLYDLRLMNDLNEILDLLNNKHNNTYVFYYKDILFGYAVIKQEKNLNYLMSHYNLKKWNIENRFYEQHGRLEFFSYSPIFQNRWQFLLSELHRFTNYKQIYYLVKSKPQDKVVTGILENLLLAEPYQKMVYNLHNLNEMKPSLDVLKEEPPFALFFSTIHHISVPRINVNTKIVIVGASTMGIVFVMALVAKQNLKHKVFLSNVTFVTPHAFNNQTDDISEQIFMKQSYLTKSSLTMYALDTYVNVIYGTMTAIDRKEKRIVINGNGCLNYDYLILTVGEQYQVPQICNDQQPKNVYVINTDVDARYAVNDVKKNIHQEGFFIIYGDSVEVYSCMATLLNLGIKGKYIKYLSANKKGIDSNSGDYLQFNNHKIYNAVYNQIQDSGIDILSGYNLLKWDVNPDTGRVKTVTFESRHKLLDLPCIGIFCYGSRTVSKITFTAIIKSGIVFDGKIVIDNECKTNDPYIYAAGGCTKYARRYYADHLNHQYFNPMEIGYKLAQNIRELLITNKYREEEEFIILKCKTNKNLVPMYKWPLITVCKLPGNLKYIYIRKPGKPVPLAVVRDLDSYGYTIRTGNLDNLAKRGYFHIHFNELDEVETITCLTKKNVEAFNLINIWGMHERMLNNLKARYKSGSVYDLYDYFEEPWSTAIYHQTFKELNKSFSKLLKRLSIEKDNSLIEDLLKIFSGRTTALNDAEFKILFEKFITSYNLVAIKNILLDYLIDNMNILPMYAQPMILKGLLLEHELRMSNFFVRY